MTREPARSSGGLTSLSGWSESHDRMQDADHSASDVPASWFPGGDMRPIPRPQPGEYAPYTTEYFDLVPGEDVVAHMRRCLETTPAFFRDIPEDRLSTPHRAGEWTIKQILLHISDDERVYVYRTLRFARNDLTELPSFDQEVVAAHSDAESRSIASLLEEYVTVRRATLSFFESVPTEALTRVGIANGNPMSVRAAAFHIAGHELHHLDSIRTNLPGIAGNGVNRVPGVRVPVRPCARRRW